MKLDITIDGKTKLSAEKGENEGEYSINGKTFVADVIAKTNKHFILHINNSPIEIYVLEFDKSSKKSRLWINGKTVTVTGEDDMDRLLKQMGMEAGSSKKMKELKAPMPGLVVDVLVKPGDTIEKDSALVILEAMKMENVLKAQGTATVLSVEIKKGQAVEKNEVLIKFA